MLTEMMLSFNSTLQPRHFIFSTQETKWMPVLTGNRKMKSLQICSIYFTNYKEGSTEQNVFLVGCNQS
jgi:hypothetical protein